MVEDMLAYRGIVVEPRRSPHVMVTDMRGSYGAVNREIGLTACGLASDLSIGLSTIGKWIASITDEVKVAARDGDLLCENERLRKENRILREERQILS